MNLSDEEVKFLSRFEKYAKTFYLNYLGVIICFCLTLFGLIQAVKFRSEKGLSLAIFAGSIGLNLLVATRVYQKFYKILIKIKQHIPELGENRKI